MNKAVLISIQPKWCKLIANGKKTIEIRKSRPKLATPFKCYIYCTRPKFDHEDFTVVNAGTENAFAFHGGGLLHPAPGVDRAAPPQKNVQAGHKVPGLYISL